MPQKIALKSCLALLICYPIQAQARTQANPSHKTRALFAVYEGSRVNLYSANLDGSRRKLLLSRKAQRVNAGPSYAIYAKLSPRGDLIAHKTPGHGYSPVFLMAANGQNSRLIVGEAQDFYWSPDGTSLIYSGALPPPDPTTELSGHEDGYEWHIVSVLNGKDEILAPREMKLHRFGVWIGPRQILFISYSIAREFYYSFDLDTRTATEIELPSLASSYIEASVHPGLNRTLVSVAQRDSPCTLYELGVHSLALRHITSLNHRCETLAWNGDEEFYFGTWVNVPDKRGPGYYELGSVHKYNLKTNREESVVQSNGREVYRLQAVLAGKALIVSNESITRSPRYILEVRSLDGRHPVRLHSNARGISFIGLIE